VNLATVGTSFITDHFIQAVLKEGSFTLTTVFSRTEEHARTLADRFSIPLIQTDWEALLADKNIEVVYIATPNDTHYDLAKQVLQAKKHVILEKPFVSNSAEFKGLLETAAAHNRYVFDAIIPMHLPNYAILKEAVKKVGTLRMVNISMVQRSSRYPALQANQEPAIFSLKHSGGALMDLGVYPISILLGLFGVPENVDYTCQKYANGIDVNGVLTLTYPGFLAVAVVAKDSAGRNFATYSGDLGYIELDKAPSIMSTVTLVEKENRTELGLPQDNQPMVYELKDFYDVIVKHDDETYGAWMALTQQVITVLDACRKKADLVFAADGELKQ